MSLYDGFVKISQYGGGTASLNVSVAAGIILHRFYAWEQSQPRHQDKEELSKPYKKAVRIRFIHIRHY
jgi:hypothetical protein